MFPCANAQTGNHVQNTRTNKPNRKHQIKPLEYCKELRRWGTLLLVLPHFRIGKESVEHRVMCKNEQDSEKSQTCPDEMEYREQLQVVCVNLALVSGNGGSSLITHSNSSSPRE